jgi:hypothetical protein
MAWAMVAGSPEGAKLAASSTLPKTWLGTSTQKRKFSDRAATPKAMTIATWHVTINHNLRAFFELSTLRQHRPDPTQNPPHQLSAHLLDLALRCGDAAYAQGGRAVDGAPSEEEIAWSGGRGNDAGAVQPM